MQVKEINHGVACRIGNTIYLNKNLVRYPKLREAIMKHEEAHTNSFNLKDIKLDLGGIYLKRVKKQYYQFILENPRAMSHFSPIWMYEGKFVIDPIMSAVWIMGIGFVVLLRTLM